MGRSIKIIIIVLLVFWLGMDISKFILFEREVEQNANYMRQTIAQLNVEIEEDFINLEKLFIFRAGSRERFEDCLKKVDSYCNTMWGIRFINLKQERHTDDLRKLIKKYGDSYSDMDLLKKISIVKGMKSCSSMDSLSWQFIKTVIIRQLLDGGLSRGTGHVASRWFAPDIVIKQEAENLIHVGEPACYSSISKCLIRVAGEIPEGNSETYIIKKRKHIFVESQLVILDYDYKLDTITDSRALELVWSDSHYMPFQYPRW